MIARLMNRLASDDFEGARVLILKGPAAGSEGICLGKTADGETWAITPDDSDAILNLRYPEEFGLLMDLSARPEMN
jgi:hypothetical protein